MNRKNFERLLSAFYAHKNLALAGIFVFMGVLFFSGTLSIEKFDLFEVKQAQAAVTLTSVDSGSVSYNDIFCVTSTDCKIAYRDITNGDLVMVDCDNATCSSKTTTVVDSVTSASVGQYVSIYCVSSTDCKIAYQDGTNTNLMMADCDNATCSTKTITVVDSTTSASTGDYTSIYCVSSTDCKISYRDLTNTNLMMADCDDSACSTKTLTTVDSVTSASTGSFSSIYCLSSTDCKISYRDVTNTNLMMADCDDSACSTKTLTTVDSVSGSDTGQLTSITCLSSTDCKIAYHDSTNTNLMMADCDDSTCSTKTLTVVDPTTSVNATNSSNSISCFSATSCFIAYKDDAVDDTMLAQCYNATCSSKTLRTIDSTTSATTGGYTSVSCTSATTCSESYVDTTANNDLYVAYFNDTEQRPLSTYIGTSDPTNQSYCYNMGYKFTPNSNGSISKLWYKGGGGTATIRLYNHGTQAVLATASGVTPGGVNSWVSASITPVNVTSGTAYVVAASTTAACGGGYSSYGSVPATPSPGDVTINNSVYDDGSGSAFPSNNGGATWYGQADISFTPGGGYGTTSTQTGNWNVGTTWGGACASSCTAGVDYPATSESVTIANGHTVTLTASQGAVNVTVATGGTLSLGSYILSLSGTGTPLTATGSFNANTGTVNYTSGSGVTALSSVAMTGAKTYYNLTINGTGTFSATSAFDVAGDLTVTAGTLTSANSTTTNGIVSVTGTLTYTGASVFTHSSTTSKSFGGSGNMTFYSLTMTGVSGTTATTGAGSVSVNSVLTLDASHTFNAGSKTWYLYGSGTPFSRSGTYNSETSTFTYASTTGATIAPNITYYNLTIDPQSGTTPTFYLNSFTSLNGSLTIDGSTGTVFNASAINSNWLALDGAISSVYIGANNTFVAPSSGAAFYVGNDWTNNGTFTHSNGTVTFWTSSQADISGNNTFYGFTSTIAGKAIRFAAGSTTTINGLLTLTGTNGNNITLNSSTGSSSWTINHQGTENITYTTVTYSACHGSSTTITATGTGNTNGGNNGVCWTFPVTYNLTSSQTGNWNVGTTWGGACASSCTAGVHYPGTGESVVIANGHTVTVNAAQQTAGLTVNGGGILAFSGSPTLTITGAFSNSGTVTPNNGTITMNTGSSISNAGTLTFYNLTTSAAKGAGSITTNTNFSVSGVFTVGASTTVDPSSGTVTMSNGSSIANSGTLSFQNFTVGGSITQTGDFTVKGDYVNNGSQNGGSGTMTLSGSGTSISGTAGLTGPAINITMTNNKTIQAGSTVTFNSPITLSASTTITNNGTTIVGHTIDGVNGSTSIWTQGANSSVEFTSTTVLPTGVLNASASGNTVNYDGPSQTCKDPSSSTYFHLIFSVDPAMQGSGGLTKTCVSRIVSGDLTLSTSGSFTVSHTMSIAKAVAGNVVIGASTTLVTGAYTLTIGGNFTNSGTFTGTSGTVEFNNAGLTSTLTGSNTFNNFTVTTAGKAVRFTAGTTTTINGVLTLTGANGNNVTLNSNTGSSSWTINHQGTENITYTTVTYSACHGSSTQISATTSNGNTNGGNNGACWIFISYGLTSTQTGNWNAGTTWGGACASACTAGVDYPNISESVVIANGHTVSLTQNQQAVSVTINSTGTLSLGSSYLYLSGSGTPLTRNGTFTAGTGTVYYSSATGISALSSAAMTGSNKYYGLIIGGTGTFTQGVDIEIGGPFTVNVSNTFNGGSLNATMNNGSSISNSGSLSFGNLVIANSATVTANTSFTVGGLNVGSGATLSPTSGTITVANYASILQNYGTLSFQNVTFSAPGGGQIGTGNFTVKGAMTNNASSYMSFISGTVTMENGSSIANSDTLSFTNLTIANSATVTANTSFSVNGIVTVGTGATLTPTSGTITMNTGSSIANSGTLTFNNLTLASSAAVSATGNFGVRSSATMTISSGAVFTPNASTVVTGTSATLTGSGTVKVTRTTATADFATQYAFTTRTLTSLIVDYAGTGQSLNNYTYGSSGSGGLTISGSITGATADATVAGTFNVTGTFTPSAGTITMNGGGVITNAGTLTFRGLTTACSSTTVTANTSFTVVGTLTNGNTCTLSPSSGTITFNNGSSIVNSGTTLSFQNITVASGATVTANTNFTVKGTLTNSSTGTLNPSSGTITISGGGAIVNSGTTLSFQNLTTSCSSTTVTANTSFIVKGTLTHGSTCTLNQSSGTVTFNNGSAISNSGTLTFNNLTVASGATVTANTSFSIAGTLTNSSTGTLNPTSGTITFNNGSSIVNSGTTLSFQNLTTNTSASVTGNTSYIVKGVLTNGSSASFTSNSGTVTMNNGSSIVNSGTTLTFNNLTVDSGATVTANTSFAVSGVLTNSATGVLNPNSGTVTMNNGSSIVNSGTTLSFQNLTIANSATVTANTSYNVKGILTNGSGGTYTANAGTQTFENGSSIVNSGTQLTFNNLTVNTGATVTANTSYTVAGTLTVNSSGVLSPTSGTIILSGTGTPLSIAGTFTTTGTNTIQYTGATANVTARTFNNLTLGGTGTYTMPASTTTINGNLVLTSGSTVVKDASATLVFASSANQTITDNTAGKQDLGNVQISTALGFSTLMGSSLKMTSLIIDTTKTFSSNGANTLTLTGNGASVFVPTGTFTPSTGTVEFASTSTTGTTVPAYSYNHLIINRASNVFTAAGAISANNFTITAGSFSAPATTLTLAGNFTNSGTFTHNSGTVVIAPALSDKLTQFLGNSSTTFNNFTAESRGTELRFKGGLTYGFSNTLTLTGANSEPILLSSDVPGVQWLVTLGETQSLNYVRVKDGGCSGSNTLANSGNSRKVYNGGNNDSCWGFISLGGIIGSSGGSSGSGSSSGGCSVNCAGGGGGASVQATATANLTEGTIGSVTVTNGGSGYTQAPAICFQDSVGSGATATATISNGIVTLIAVTSTGNRSYTGGTTVGIAAPPGTGGSGCSSGSGQGGGGGGGGGASP